MAYNQDYLDTLALLSFIIGIVNYEENLTQSDKDDIMQSLDKQTRDILTKIKTALDDQNTMLKEISDRLDEIEEKLNM